MEGVGATSSPREGDSSKEVKEEISDGNNEVSKSEIPILEKDQVNEHALEYTKRIGIQKLHDKSVYHGELNDEQLAHGTGCIYFAPGGYYCGQFVDGKRHGGGVYSFPDGSRYEGDFLNDMRDGYGIYMIPVGEKYRGQWKENSQFGYGEWTAWNGDVKYGKFIWNDYTGECDSMESCLDAIRLASLAQQRAIVFERQARVNERLAYAQDNLSIEGVYIKDDASYQAFEDMAKNRQRDYVSNWQREFNRVEECAQEGKTEEATLGERQKQQHVTIRAKREELARYSMFWDIVVEKERSLIEAKRILASIEKQIEIEELVDAEAATTSKNQSSEPKS